MTSSQISVRRHGISHVETYEVTTDELRRLEAEGGDVGLDFQIAQGCFTTALSFLATLIVSPPKQETIAHTAFVVIVVVGFFIGAISGIRCYRNQRAFSRTIQDIRDRQVGPVGEEGKELKSSDLAAIKAVQPGENS